MPVDRQTRIPGPARRLLRALVGSAQATEIEPSLAELFALRAHRDGAVRAHLWILRQVFGFGLRRRSLRSARAWQTSAALHGGPGGWRPGAGDAVRDLRLAARSLLRRPGFSALAVVTLTLGIGANTAIFSVLYGSLLRPLPYARTDRLVWLSDGHEAFGGAGANQSVPNLLDIQAASRLLQSMAIYKVRNGNLVAGGEPQRVSVLYASSPLLSTLGVPPQLGRDLAPDDDLFGSEPVAILTDGLWRSRFGADPRVVGASIRMDARAVRVVGIAAPGFVFPGRPQLIMPLQHRGAPLVRGNRGHWALGRLATGATLDGLREELQGIFDRLVEEYPEANEGWFTWAEPLRDRFVAGSERSLWLLAGAAALVLLMACVNVANLMLVRAETRQRELAVRYSLGATRGALVLLFLSEGLILSLLGGLAGVAVARPVIDVLVSLYGGDLPRGYQIGLNWPVLTFGLIVSLIVGAAVGLVPVLRSRPSDVHESLKEGARGSSVRGSRLGRALVVGEIALAVLIVVAAGLLTHSMWRLQQVELGIDEGRQALTFSVSLPSADYGSATTMDAFLDTLVDRLGRLPGVRAAAVVNRLPLLGGDNTTVSRFDDPEVEANFVSSRMVGGDYFAATGARLLAGRLLDDTELVDGGRSVVINQTLARQLFGSEDVVGRRITDPMMPPDSPLHAADGLEIVGVIADIGGGRADRPPPPAFYYALQVAIDMLAAYPDLIATEQVGMSALVRTADDPRAAVPAVREAVAAIDPDVPIYDVRTLQDIADERLEGRRFAMSLFGAFAALALALGAVGIYGVMSYSVARRSRELGVRMALGANRRSLLRLILGEAARLSAPGIAVGLLAAMAAARLLDSLLYQVAAVDVPTYAAVALLLAAICLGSAYAPARRATRVDPLTSIREE